MAETQKKSSMIKENAVKKYLFHFLESGIIFFVLTLVTRRFFHAFSFSELRPASTLTPIFGMIFGIPGVLGCTFFNFINDLIFGYSIGICSFNILIQFVYGFVPCLIWTLFTKKDKENRLRIDSLFKFIVFLLILIVANVIVTLFSGFELKFFGVAEIFSKTTKFIFLNNFIFSILSAFPIMMIASFCHQKNFIRKQAEFKRVKFSIIETFILFFILFSLILVILIGTKLFVGLANFYSEPLDLWNKVDSDLSTLLSAFLLGTIFFLAFVEKTITNPLKQMSKIATHYGDKEDAIQNNLDIIKACEDYLSLNSEIGDLARSYVYLANDMTEFIKSLQTVSIQKANYEKDLVFANQIQKSLLPQIFPTFIPSSAIDIYGSVKFSHDFGGDFYDYFLIDHDHLAVIIADVSGRGVEAAIYMSIVKNLIKDKMLAGLLPDEALSEINQQLSKDNVAGLFVSVWLGVLNISSGKFYFVNAGQPQPIFMKKGEDFQLVDSPVDLALAVSDETLYTLNTRQLSVGDKVVFYTKGITEAQNSFGERFGIERIKHCFNKHKEMNSQELVKELNSELVHFTKDAEQESDFTILAMEYLNP